MEKIVCFALLKQLINDKIQLSAISKDELLFTYSQLKSFKQGVASIETIDTRVLGIIVHKTRKAFY